MKNSYQSSWIFRDTLGIFLGIAVAAGAITFETHLLGEPMSPLAKLGGLGFALVGGLLAGTILAWFQWSVLKRRYKSLSWPKWWRNTVLAFIGGWVLAIVPSLTYTGANEMREVVEPFGIPVFTVEYGSIIFGGLFGAFLGFAQWFELRKYWAEAGQWIGANVFSWAFGFFLIALAGLILPGTGPLDAFLITGLGGGLLAALCVAGFTSLFFDKAANA